MLDKAPQLPPDVQWHFIGHLQSNKVKAVVGARPEPAALLRAPAGSWSGPAQQMRQARSSS
jgi:hypothetical protein